MTSFMNLRRNTGGASFGCALMLATMCVFGVLLDSGHAGKVAHNALSPVRTRGGRWTRNGMPFIRFEQGCMSYPAVNERGDYSGGLKPTGSPGGGCRTASRQQVYTRTARLNAKRYPGAYRAVMYAYFFPKDQGNRYGRLPGGHRYDWEEVIVFFKKNGAAIKAAASSHGGYTTVSRSGSGAKYWSGNRPKVKYGLKNKGSLLNNGLYFTTKGSTDRPTEANWKQMSRAMRKTISIKDWGAASPKIKNSKFGKKLAEAWRS